MKIKLFALSTCAHCKAVKKFFWDHNIPYDVTDVDLVPREERSAVLEEIKKYNPKCSFPTIIIEDTVIVGNKEDEIREALGIK